MFLLSGCGLRAWVDVEIEGDSTGTVVLQLASDEQLRSGLAAFSPDTDAVGQLSEGLADRDWVIEPMVDGEWEGVIATHDFVDLEELAALLDEAVQAGGSNITLEETSSAYLLSAELGPPATDDNQADLLRQAADVIDLDGRLTVAFPGEVTSTNGSVSDDGASVTWTYDEESLTGFSIQAEARKPSSPLLPVLAAVAVVGLAIGAIVVRGRKKRRPGEPVAP